MPRLVSLCAVLLVAAGPVGAQSIAGRILDDRSDHPVVGVTVELRGARGQYLGTTQSDDQGAFSFALPQAGTYRLLASRIGYLRVDSPGFDVAAGEALELDLRISASSFLLSPLTITSRAEPPRSRQLERVGFYERERRSRGIFVRRDHLDRDTGARLSDVLLRMPGVRRVTMRGRSGITLGRQAGCPPQVVLNGLPIMESQLIDDIVHVRAIEALEVYRGPAETPVEFARGESGCGVVVIWTRERA